MFSEAYSECCQTFSEAKRSILYVWQGSECSSGVQSQHPASIYLLKVNRNTTARCEICSKLTRKTTERRLVSLLLTLNVFTHCSSVSIVNLEHVIASWARSTPERHQLTSFFSFFMFLWLTLNT